MSRYQKGKTNLDFTEARDSEWQWHQLGRMLVCTSLQTDNHASTPPLCLMMTMMSACWQRSAARATKRPTPTPMNGNTNNLRNNLIVDTGVRRANGDVIVTSAMTSAMTSSSGTPLMMGGGGGGGGDTQQGLIAPACAGADGQVQ